MLLGKSISTTMISRTAVAKEVNLINLIDPPRVACVRTDLSQVWLPGDREIGHRTLFVEHDSILASLSRQFRVKAQCPQAVILGRVCGRGPDNVDLQRGTSYIIEQPCSGLICSARRDLYNLASRDLGHGSLAATLKPWSSDSSR